MDERIAQMKRLEGEKKMSKVSMKGVIDMHVHTNPDLRLRAYDDFEMMEAGIRVGARAIVLKTHQGTTMGLPVQPPQRDRPWKDQQFYHVRQHYLK